MTKSTMTPRNSLLMKRPILAPSVLTTLAAVMGGSNLGMDLPEQSVVEELCAMPDLTLETAVMRLWRQYMESDEHYKMFMSECRWWLEDRNNFARGRNVSATPDYVNRVWPDVAKLFGWSTWTTGTIKRNARSRRR